MRTLHHAFGFHERPFGMGDGGKLVRVRVPASFTKIPLRVDLQLPRDHQTGNHASSVVRAPEADADGVSVPGSLEFSE